ncbi:unnamed protein product [Agarophyton chilense]
MQSLLKNTLAFILGLVTSSVVMSAVQSLGSRAFPVSPSPESPMKHVLSPPLGAYLFMEASYILGSILGGFVLAKLACSHTGELIMALGIVLTVFGVQNVITIAHPLWFAVVSLCTFLPGVHYGAKLAHTGGSEFV